MRGPDFFIVGAPKCGTTAMADYLGQHPEVGMCPVKESHYFATDLRTRLAVKKDQRPPTRDSYLQLFEGLEQRARRGEASVWYLYSSAAPHEIAKFCPGARIIAMLRNPVEMLPSLHSQFVYMGLEPEEDFERALALDAKRELSGTPRGFPPRSYRAAARFAEQLHRYLDVFGHDRVHTILFDDFRDDTLSAYSDTCEFLGVDTGFRPEIKVVNPNTQVRSRTLRSLVRPPPEPLRKVVHAVTSREMRRRGGAALNRWNTRVVPRQPAPESAVESLRPLVAEEVDLLRDMAGVDASRWLD